MKKFKELWYNKSHNTYNRDNYIKDINKSIPGHNYTSEQLEDIVEKLEASRGYSQNDIKKEFLEQIEEDHGYNKSQMTKMLEKLNEIDHYAILHYATIFNNVPFCKIIIEDYGCSKALLFYSHVNDDRI
jgi:transcriptional regulator NrdR family protein